MIASKSGSQQYAPPLSCFVSLENAQHIFSGNIWPQLVHEKQLCVSHLEKKEVADLKGETKNVYELGQRAGIIQKKNETAFAQSFSEITKPNPNLNHRLPFHVLSHTLAAEKKQRRHLSKTPQYSMEVVHVWSIQPKVRGGQLSG